LELIKIKQNERVIKIYFNIIADIYISLMCKGQQKEFLSTKIMDQYHSEVDSSTVIKLKNPVIQIGDKVYVAEKRKVFYSVEDYMVYGQYKSDKTIITFYINPDSSEIIMLTVKTNYLTYYK